MTDAERQLIEDRAVRDSARAVVAARMARIRGDLEEKSVGARLGSEALGRARKAGDSALDVAREYKWVVAGTGVAVAAWMLQAPILEGARFALHRLREGEPPALWQRLRKLTLKKVKS